MLTKAVLEELAEIRLNEAVALLGAGTRRIGGEPESKVAADPIFAENWEYVEAWSENARYTATDEESAGLLVEGLRDPNYGVFQWIRLHW
jgi:hypothetical protein